MPRLAPICPIGVPGQLMPTTRLFHMLAVVGASASTTGIPLPIGWPHLNPVGNATTTTRTTTASRGPEKKKTWWGRSILPSTSLGSPVQSDCPALRIHQPCSQGPTSVSWPRPSMYGSATIYTNSRQSRHWTVLGHRQNRCIGNAMPVASYQSYRPGGVLCPFSPGQWRCPWGIWMFLWKTCA